jgi:glutamate racemase
MPIRGPTSNMPDSPKAPSAEPFGAPTVGVFDSGVGGLSVLRALREHLPQAQWVYVADSANAPYGERDEGWLQQRCLHLSQFLCQRGAKLLVVACNTATAAALPALRQAMPDMPIVGVEPGLKPAVLQSTSKRVGVWATGTTLGSPRWAALMAAHGRGAQVHVQACKGLAWAIEQGDAHAVQALVEQYAKPMREAHVDTLVLGCTHYAFASPWIEQALGPEVVLIDTAAAVARRVASLVGGWPPPPSGTPQASAVQMWTSAAPARLEGFAQRWLQWTVSAQALGALPPPVGAAPPAAATPAP